MVSHTSLTSYVTLLSLQTVCPEFKSLLQGNLGLLGSRGETGTVGTKVRTRHRTFYDTNPKSLMFDGSSFACLCVVRVRLVLLVGWELLVHW